MFRGNGRGSSRLRSSTWGFAFSKIQNSTFSKLCPPSKGNLLMGNFSERLTQNEIYFPNFHQYMQSQKWKLQCIVKSSTRHIIREVAMECCNSLPVLRSVHYSNSASSTGGRLRFFLVLKARRQRSSSIDQICPSKGKCGKARDKVSRKRFLYKW